MRPVTRPAVSAAYQARQALVQPFCIVAQLGEAMAEEEETRSTQINKVYGRVLAEYGKRKALPAFNEPALPDTSNENLQVQKTRLDGYEARIRAALGNKWTINAKSLSDADLTTALTTSSLYVRLSEPYLDAVQAIDVDTAKQRAASVYGEARGDLIAGLGQYCSYCEMPATANLAVEHMVPKASFPLFAANWDNFLLACSACNSLKLNNPAYGSYDDHSGPDGVRAQALASMRFPNDPEYDNFDDNFTYVAKQVVRVGVDELFSQVLNDQAIYAGVPWPFEVIGSEIGGITARSYQNVAQVQLTAAEQAVFAAFVAGANTQDVANVPAKIKSNWGEPAAYGTCTRADVRDDATRTSFILTHAVAYGFDLTGAFVKITRPAPAADIVTTVKPNQAKPWLRASALPYGLLNPAVAAQGLGYPVYPKVVAAKAADAGLFDSKFNVTLTNTYLVKLTKATGILQTFAAVESPVELHLVRAGTAAAAAAATAARVDRTLQLLDLNDNRVAATPVVIDGARRRKMSRKDDNNLVNRRLFWRTRTWVTAMDSLRRAKQVRAVLTAAPDAAAGVLFQDVLGETIKATGCWSVWRTVTMKEPDGPIRAGMLTLMGSGAGGLFPGTR